MASGQRGRCGTDKLLLPPKVTAQADEACVARIAGHLLTPCSESSDGLVGASYLPKSAYPMCGNHQAMWNATLEEFGLPRLSEVGPMKPGADGKYGRFVLRDIPQEFSVSALQGRSMVARLPASELRRLFEVDAMPTETGYQFHAVVLGMLDAKASRVRVCFEGFQRYVDVKTEEVLDGGSRRIMES